MDLYNVFRLEQSTELSFALSKWAKDTIQTIDVYVNLYIL